MTVSPRIREKLLKPKLKVIKTRDKRPSKIASVGRFLLQVPWSDLFLPDQSCEDKLSILTEIVNYGLDTIMPERSVRVHETDRPWMNSQLKALIALRQKALATNNVPLFKILRNKVNRERKRCRKIYYENKVKGLRDTKPRNWWREVKQLCGTAKETGRDLRTILHPNLVFDDNVLSEKINGAFVSVMQGYSPLSENILVASEDDEPLSVTEAAVARKLRAVSTSRAGGPDNLPNWVLKEYADILAFPIADILNTSFLECKVPRVWKLANVPPLPKVPTISNFTKDLRPISLTSTLSKVAEDIVIEKELRPTILSSIDPGQFGFIPGSSTTFALISMLHYWLCATDGNGATVRTALLDYRKAFDLVDHHLLIAKLFSLGVKPTIVNWIIDFLRNRQQRVKLNNNCYSSWLNVSAGVPQGTRLGPWLFLVMINDLKLPGGSFSMWKFADDTTVSEVVPSSGESSLQEAVNHISSWSHSNHFQLNPTKCKELIVCFQKIPPPYSPITIDGMQFQRVSSAKVLGVTISNDLKWNDHVDTITSKAARRLYLLSQLKRAGISSDDLLAFYYSVIRSVLEFSCQLFHRSLPKYLSDDIERIQRRAMRIIFPNLSYCEALNKAGIPTLSERRESLSIKLFEDIVSNEHHKLANLLPQMSSSYARRLRNKRRFNTPICRTDRFMNSFIISHAM